MKSFQYKPNSQLSPLYPSGQMHVKPFTFSLQIPSFWHGLDEHSTISISEEKGVVTCYTATENDTPSSMLGDERYI